MKKQYNTVDLFKLFFSICIVAIHTEVLSSYSDKTQWFVNHILFRLAVPYFFIVSGYFLGIKLYNSKTKNDNIVILKHYIINLIPPFIFWGTANLILFGAKLYFHNGNRLSDIAIQMLQTAVFYPLGAMWFVGACIFGAIIICLLWNNKRLLIVVAIIGYTFALISNTYYFIIENTSISNIVNGYLKICLSARNGLFVGLPLLGIGVLMALPKICNRVNNKVVLIVTFLSSCTYILEIVFAYDKNTKDDSSLFISTIILVPCLVWLCLKNNLVIKNKNFLNLRMLSRGIFYTHAAVCLLLRNILPYGWILFFVTLCISVISTLTLNKINNKYFKMII